MRETNPTDALIAYAKKFPRQSDAAVALKISPAYLSDLINGRRDVTDPLLEKLGLRRIVVSK
jgi:plasmid maintenance system antidote protein VapI